MSSVNNYANSGISAFDLAFLSKVLAPQITQIKELIAKNISIADLSVTKNGNMFKVTVPTKNPEPSAPSAPAARETPTAAAESAKGVFEEKKQTSIVSGSEKAVTKESIANSLSQGLQNKNFLTSKLSNLPMNQKPVGTNHFSPQRADHATKSDVSNAPLKEPSDKKAKTATQHSQNGDKQPVTNQMSSKTGSSSETQEEINKAPLPQTNGEKTVLNFKSPILQQLTMLQTEEFFVADPTILSQTLEENLPIATQQTLQNLKGFCHDLQTFLQNHLSIFEEQQTSPTAKQMLPATGHTNQQTQFLAKALLAFAKMFSAENNSLPLSFQNVLRKEMATFLIFAQVIQNGNGPKLLEKSGNALHFIEEAVQQLIAKGDLPHEAMQMLRTFTQSQNMIALLLPWFEKMGRIRKKRRKKPEEADEEEIEEEFNDPNEPLC